MDISEGILLTVTALLAVILLVWAQLWLNTCRTYQEKQKKVDATVIDNIDSSTNLVLTWTYGAVFFAMIAFAFIALSIWGGDTLKKLGIGLLGVSFSMLIIDVLISLICAGIKFWNYKKFDEPYYLSLDKRLSRYMLIGLPVCFTVFSLSAAFSRIYWLMFGNLAVTVIAGIIITEVLHRKNDRSKDTA